MNKLIQLALFFTLIVTGCSNSSSTSSEPKAETVQTAVAFNQKELEKELKKLKPVSLEMKFESPLAAELGKLKAKEEAEKQRQIEAAKKREKEREAKQQEEEAERQRLAERQATAERQRLAEAKRQAELERQRQAAVQKEQEANAEKKRQSQTQRQQTEVPSSNSQNAPSSSKQTDDTIQQPASELPDDDGYGYEERKKWHDDQVEWGIKQGYIDPEDAP
ncbi:hypothetical protein ACT3UT_09740 [Bacillus spizizenii ATCC 6633 = JCM 2499]|uniref:Putative lipoprotein n=1 Tax=Bacillus spizizenii (strain ATCC 23059 / NRRL B-14472 / W23) TaxID=655816 RepID=E0TWI8_BACSH|nr:hypothetical protein [Bacillus spizizenii]QCJ17962.1 hypothetical protein FA024_12790 [Bacillus subtilis]ADM38845.1 putative lipoprotein [Bacillus spizizenii str. W23]AJW84380.1 hypothetical protein BIS30_03875 [Bacillus spizizenii]EFG92034.1 putative lipoprotein [Bacillus spizizenii ATCC 6633 = JCM 2499]KFK78239.1 hypothetical protein DJ97_1917 [Bacillus spizizenii]